MEAGTVGMAINYKLQDKFLESFFSDRFGTDFYLTGGTALARFYYHHRESLDLDLFTQNQNLDFSDLRRLVQNIALSMKLKTINEVTTNSYLQFIFNKNSGGQLKIDFVREIPLHFGHFVMKKNVRVDSLENIGSNKILAVFGRTDQKDFIDLYYILNNSNLTFDYLLSLAKKKDLGLNEFYLANSINQFEKSTEMPKLLKSMDLKKYRKFYRELTRKLLLSVKPPI